MAVISHVKVQRGTTTFGASATSTTVTLGSPVSSLSKAFARVTGVVHGASDPAAGTTGNRNNVDVGCYAVLTAVDTVTLTLDTGRTAEDRTVYWEVWEYTGPAGGQNEFVVLEHGTASMSGGATSFTTGTNHSGDDTQMVVFHCGQINNVATQTLGSLLTRLRTTGSSPNINVLGNRGGNGGTTVVAYALVEFTGSAWQVQKVSKSLTSADIGVNNSTAISTVNDWAKTMIIPSGHQRPGTAATNSDCGILVWPGADVTHVLYRLDPNYTTGGGNLCIVEIAIVYNPDLVVQHLDSQTGGGTDATGGGAAPQNFDTTVTSLRDLDHAAMIAFANNDSTATSYPSACWAYAATTTTNLRMTRARTVGGAEWALQGVDFNDVGYFEQTLDAALEVTPTVDFIVDFHVDADIDVEPSLSFSVDFHADYDVDVTPLLNFVVGAPEMSVAATVTPTLTLTHNASAVAVRVTRLTAEWLSKRGNQRVRPLQ